MHYFHHVIQIRAKMCPANMNMHLVRLSARLAQYCLPQQAVPFQDSVQSPRSAATPDRILTRY